MSDKHVYSFELAGRPLTFEIGELAKQANASVLVRYGDTVVLSTCVASKEPKDITVGDILVVLEGPVSLSDCVMDEDICENSGKCVTKIVWEKMKKGIEDVINSITLQDMIDDHNKNILDNDITNLIIK